MTPENFNALLTTALRLGVIDIFTVIAYQVNGVTSDRVLVDLAEKVKQAQS